MQLKNKIITIVAFGLLAGCSRDFGDTNTNPQALTANTFHGAMTAIQSQLNIPDYNEQTFARNELTYPLSQLTAQVKQIGVDPVGRSTDAIWGDYYKFLANVNELNVLIEGYTGNQDLQNIIAMRNVLIAYKTFHVASYYGDIPFSEGGKAFSTTAPVFRPKYDDQKEIFTKIFTDLKWAADNFTINVTSAAGKPYLSLGSNDVIYNSNFTKWKKLTNSLLLKYAVFLADKESAMVNPVIADILNNNKPLLDINEDFEFNPSMYTSPRDRRGSFQAAGSCGVRLGETIWKYLSSTTTPIDTSGVSIFDYRTYVFFEKNAYGSWYPAKQTGNTETDFGDVYSNDRVNTPSANKSRYASVNIQLLGDRKLVSDILLSSSEVQFLKAEAYARGLGVAKDWAKAETAYNLGIEYSIKYWSKIAQGIETWTVGKPAAATAADIAIVQNHTKVKFAGVDSEAAKLAKVYSQYWLSLFWQPEEAFFLMRRTLATPVTGSYDAGFYRLLYPIAEKEKNQQNYTAAAAKMGNDVISFKQWWMK